MHPSPKETGLIQQCYASSWETNVITIKVSLDLKLSLSATKEMYMETRIILIKSTSNKLATRGAG